MSVNTSAPVWRGAMSIAAAAVAWGTGGAVAVVLYRTSGLGPIAVSFWRFVVAVIALAALQAATKRENAPVRWRSAALTGGGLAIYLTAYFGSVHFSGVAVGTLVTLGIGPVLIALGAHYLLGEHLTRWQAAAIAVALAGLIMLAAGSGEAGSNPMLGIALAFVSAAGYSAVTLYTRAGHAQGANLPVFAIGMICLAPIAIGEGALPQGEGILASTAWLIFLGLVPTFFAYQWFFSGLATVPAATASVITLLEPVTATVIAVGVLGESLTITTITGTVLLLAAVALLAGRTST